MASPNKPLSGDQVDFYNEHGYLVLRNMLTHSETSELKEWAQEVHDMPATQDCPWMPYEEINARGERVLCRTENFADHHAGFNSLLRGDRLLAILGQLQGEDMLLFKEKINYKLAGSGGYSPHIDAVAYTHVKDVKHMTILLAVDRSNMENGGLEVVDASHNMDIPVRKADNILEPGWVASQKWEPVELEAGEFLIFGSYLAHRSAANTSSQDRKAVYATYNCASEGDLHHDYYVRRKELWPATHMMKPGEKYEKGALIHGFGSPMMSLSLGKPFEV
ncbi:hypothetical protein FH972_024868 [Carpinus fangiana]|uniref:Fe2OG dioxygenase domain-containing protein n=1 Tax=Carpinus fangiana TaxID=176857 RepID=A0A5N6KZM1_9ROSI|nr:hypothetical protein FH972_024868 [Carpinus fangiana]